MGHVLWDYVMYRIDEISSLSNEDYINIVGHYTRLASEKADFDPNINTRGYSPEALAEAKKQTLKYFQPIQTLNLKFKKQLDDFEFEPLNYTLTLFENYERGLLPYPGSVSEQPAQLMEIFGVLQSLRQERQQLEYKKMQKNVGQQHKGKPRNNR